MHVPAADPLSRPSRTYSAVCVIPMRTLSGRDQAIRRASPARCFCANFTRVRASIMITVGTLLR